VRTGRVAGETGAFVISARRDQAHPSGAWSISWCRYARRHFALCADDEPDWHFFVAVGLLATLVALSRGPAIVEQLEHVKDSLSDQWIAGDEKRCTGVG